MDRAIWATWYDLDEADRGTFQHWLSSRFLPSLMQSGKYAWVANYARVDAPPEWITPDGKPQVGRAAEIEGTATQNVMIIGAAASSVFLDPLELDGEQADPSASGMLERRRNLRHTIFVEDIRVEGQAHAEATAPHPAPAIQFGEYRVRDFADELEVGQWAVQCRLPLMAAAPECVRARRLVTVAGWSKFGIIYEFPSVADRNRLWARVQEARRAGDRMMLWNMGPKTVHTPASPFVGLRTYPALPPSEQLGG